MGWFAPGLHSVFHCVAYVSVTGLAEITANNKKIDIHFFMGRYD
jgi:hypothetical protein